jgi:hypothetical protein
MGSCFQSTNCNTIKMLAETMTRAGHCTAAEMLLNLDRSNKCYCKKLQEQANKRKIPCTSRLA